MTSNIKSVQELTDEELEKKVYELDYAAATETIKRFKAIKLDIAEMKIQLDRAIKEAVISDKIAKDYKEVNREISEAYMEKVEEFIEVKNRLAYYEGDDE